MLLLPNFAHCMSLNSTQELLKICYVRLIFTDYKRISNVSDPVTVLIKCLWYSSAVYLAAISTLRIKKYRIKKTFYIADPYILLYQYTTTKWWTIYQSKNSFITAVIIAKLLHILLILYSLLNIVHSFWAKKLLSHVNKSTVQWC